MLELQVVVVQLARPVELELAPRERQVQQEQPGQRLRAQLALQARPEKV